MELTGLNDFDEGNPLLGPMEGVVDPENLDYLNLTASK
jgi:hypothetical protein